MRINYDFGDLQAFLAVKESGSFQRAAEQLKMSQSAVSRRIQKLETELDSVLFERSTRAVKATLAAKRLQPRAEAILRDAQEMTLAIIDESVSLAHQRNAIVTVAIIPSVVARLLPPSLQHCRAAGFSARIRLLEFAANEVAEAVEQGDADFGVSAIPALEPGLSFEALFEDAIGVALCADDPLAERESLTWGELANSALIMPARGTGNRLLIDEAAAKQRLRLHWCFEVQRASTALELVAAGCGVALLPRSRIDSALQPQIVFRPLVDPQVSRPVGLLLRNTQRHTAAATALIDAIRCVGQLDHM